MLNDPVALFVEASGDSNNLEWLVELAVVEGAGFCLGVILASTVTKLGSLRVILLSLRKLRSL